MSGRYDSSDGTERLSWEDWLLIDALQANPRQTWAELSRAVGRAVPTVKKQWHVLTSLGAAWVASYRGLAGGAIYANVDIDCAPADRAALISELRLVPEIVTVCSRTGQYNIIIIVVTRSLSDFYYLLEERIAGMPGIRRMFPVLVGERGKDGEQWFASQQRQLKTNETLAHTGLSDSESKVVEPILSLLEDDGRVPSNVVAREIGYTPAHSRRVISRLLDARAIGQRIEVAPRFDPDRIVLALNINSPVDSVGELQRRGLALGNTRLFWKVSGADYNVHIVGYLPSLAKAEKFESHYTHQLKVDVVDRYFVSRYHKQAGHLYDRKGAWEGQVPWSYDATERASIVAD